MKGQLQSIERVTKQGVAVESETEELVTQLRSLLSLQQDMQSNLRCLHALYYPEIQDRVDDVLKAHQQTFRWIFGSADQVNDTIHHAKFRDWLQSTDPGSNIFWIAGRLGAGKSTLMKFIARQSALEDHCETWKGTKSLLVVDHYFWNHGSLIQRSLRALFQSLLYQILKRAPRLTGEIFPDQE